MNRLGGIRGRDGQFMERTGMQQTQPRPGKWRASSGRWAGVRVAQSSSLQTTNSHRHEPCKTCVNRGRGAAVCGWEGAGTSPRRVFSLPLLTGLMDSLPERTAKPAVLVSHGPRGRSNRKVSSHRRDVAAPRYLIHLNIDDLFASCKLLRKKMTATPRTVGRIRPAPGGVAFSGRVPARDHPVARKRWE